VTWVDLRWSAVFRQTALTGWARRRRHGGWDASLPLDWHSSATCRSLPASCLRGDWSPGWAVNTNSPAATWQTTRKLCRPSVDILCGRLPTAIHCTAHPDLGYFELKIGTPVPPWELSHQVWFFKPFKSPYNYSLTAYLSTPWASRERFTNSSGSAHWSCGIKTAPYSDKG